MSSTMRLGISVTQQKSVFPVTHSQEPPNTTILPLLTFHSVPSFGPSRASKQENRCWWVAGAESRHAAGSHLGQMPWLGFCRHGHLSLKVAWPHSHTVSHSSHHQKTRSEQWHQLLAEVQPNLGASNLVEVLQGEAIPCFSEEMGVQMNLKPFLLH